MKVMNIRPKLQFALVNQFNRFNTLMPPLLLKSLKPVTATLLIFSLMGCDALFKKVSNAGNQLNSDYAIKRIADGDTITVTDNNGKDLKVRFACVDAPEIAHTIKERNSTKAVDVDQFKWGEKAKQRLQQLIKKGGDKVKLTITDTDRYGRNVSEVRLPDGTLVQQVLTQEGLVQVYKPYLKNCPSATLVQNAEADAKKRRAGVWSDKKYVPAWEWRSKNKDAG
jgi:micrococcal nuclease